MNTPLHEALHEVLIHEVATEVSDEELVKSALGEYRRGARSTSELQQQPTLIPERALSAGELLALERVGMGSDPQRRIDAQRARKEALHIFFRAYQTALPTKDVAKLLGVETSRIRQRVKERTLLALTDAGEMRFPALQFHEGREIPGLRDVLPALPTDVKPLEVLSWLATPSVELQVGNEERSPRDYLLATGDADAVIAVGQALRRGEAA